MDIRCARCRQLFQLVGLSKIFSIGSLGMGVLIISNLSETQCKAFYLAVFIVLIPAIILSGLMFPRDGMPAFTYWFSELMPVTHYLEITRGIMLKGVGAGYLWDSILADDRPEYLVFFGQCVDVQEKNINKRYFSVRRKNDRKEFSNSPLVTWRCFCCRPAEIC
jgi:hypothetical protein